MDHTIRAAGGVLTCIRHSRDMTESKGAGPIRRRRPPHRADVPRHRRRGHRGRVVLLRRSREALAELRHARDGRRLRHQVPAHSTGVFRLNIGVGKDTFLRLVGDQAEPDYVSLDQVFPHPDYAAQRWISILNPSQATFDGLVGRSSTRPMPASSASCASSAASCRRSTEPAQRDALNSTIGSARFLSGTSPSGSKRTSLAAIARMTASLTTTCPRVARSAMRAAALTVRPK